MIRISATNLEFFRKWRQKENSNTDEMIAHLKREMPPTKVMQAGTAFHKILETAALNDHLTFIEQDGFLFDFSQCDICLSLPQIREMKIEIVKEINGDFVTFVGVADAISLETREAFDHKLTAMMEVDFYADSMQWRCYLSWFELNKFTYNLFQRKKLTQENECIIGEFSSFSFYRYPNMEDDIKSITIQLIEFIKNHAPFMIK